MGSTSQFSLALSLSLNPGLSSFLPWLAPIANRFDMYSFKRLRFLYIGKTTSANTGDVDIGFDPDPTDPAPTTKMQILNWGVRCTSSPWVNCVVDVPQVDLKRLPRFLTRNAVVPGELATFDIGSLYVVASGNIANALIGQLWVQYDIELYTPQVSVDSAPTSSRSSSQFTNSVNQTLTSGTQLTMNYDTATFNPLGIAVPTTGSITGLAGAFSFYAQQTVQASALTSCYLYLIRNGVVISSSSYPVLGAAGYSTTSLFAVVSLAATDVIQVAVLATGTSPVAYNLINKFLIIQPA
jgi:hypothetical protein